MKIRLKGVFIQKHARQNHRALANYLDKLSTHAHIQFEGGDDPRYQAMSAMKSGPGDSQAKDALYNLWLHGMPGTYKIIIK